VVVVQQKDFVCTCLIWLGFRLPNHHLNPASARSLACPQDLGVGIATDFATINATINVTGRRHISAAIIPSISLPPLLFRLLCCLRVFLRAPCCLNQCRTCNNIT
jgi:hypothetical protein